MLGVFMPRKVKCLYCSKEFLREEESYVQIGNRYAHEECAKEYQEEKDYEEKIHQLIKEKCGTEYNYKRVQSQIKKFKEQKEQSISPKEIYNVLLYWYNVRKEDPAQSHGGIGIVPYIYNEALKYYREERQRKKKFEEISKERLIKERESRDNYERRICGKRPAIIRPRRVNYFNLD